MFGLTSSGGPFDTESTPQVYRDVGSLPVGL